MSSVFAEYFLEEYGKETVVTEEGFFCYKINPEAQELFFSDLHIKEEYRKTIAAKKMLSFLINYGRQKGCKIITGLVSVGVKSPERTSRILRCYLAVGFNIYKAHNNQILIGMEI